MGHHQRTLFDDGPEARSLGAYGPASERIPAPYSNPTTSRSAAKQIEPVAGTLRRRVLDHIRQQGEAGATDQEAAAALDMPENTVRPRRLELIAAGLVRDSGRTRPTAASRKAIVYVATTNED
jgi:hypothetical protein